MRPRGVLAKVLDTLGYSLDKEALTDHLAHTLDSPLISISDNAHLEAVIDKVNQLAQRSYRTLNR